MDLRKFILEQIAAAKREDDEVALQLLQALFNQLEKVRAEKYLLEKASSGAICSDNVHSRVENLVRQL